MATKDNTSGLLSKVAKFVRNPTTNWSDLDAQPVETESAYSKQALKEMIERKRQNDFVRKREFDQLRRLRNRDPEAAAEIAGRPSFYQTSIPSNLDERAVTLKKIDDIEAQMSKQWWKGKQVDAAPVDSGFPVAGHAADAQAEPVVDPELDFAITQPSAVQTEPARRAEDFAPTRMTPTLPAGLGDAGKAPAAPSRATDMGGLGFSTSRLFAVELSDDNTDPDLEEAAIRFANGDDAGAESGLLEALKLGVGQPGRAEIWTAALFDFYRATGQQARFENMALEFAEESGRSPPAWFSMPEQLGHKRAESVHGPLAEPVPDKAIWDSPASLDLASMGALHLALANAPMPWRLNWSALEQVEPNALHSLAQLFANWCSQRVRLRFDGAEVLLKVLQASTPSGLKTVNTVWWRLRMDALRVMRQQDSFELVALDYCVTYEVSPPSWVDAQCEYVREKHNTASDTGPSTLQDGYVGEGRRASDVGHALTAPMGLEDVPVVVVELTGQIAGDAAEALQRLEVGRHQGAGRLVISCARLIRVDFSAAGSILNWVASREEEGCNVQFRDVHRLVGAFFNVIGINEHARVVLRSN